MFRGTTPTFTFKLPFAASTLTQAVVSFRQPGGVSIDRELKDCTVSGDTLSCSLTEAETLSLRALTLYAVEIQLRVGVGEAHGIAGILRPRGADFKGRCLMTLEVEFQMDPMTLKAEMGEIYDVTGDEYENGYRDGVAAEQAVTDSIIDRSISGEYVNDRVTKVGDYAFLGCSALTSAHFQNAASVGNYAFYKCSTLVSVEFPSATSIGNYAFQQCGALVTLILRAESCRLTDVGAFNQTPIAAGTGYVYVPDEFVESYRANKVWATYAAQIKPLSELEG